MSTIVLVWFQEIPPREQHDKAEDQQDDSCDSLDSHTAHLYNKGAIE